MRIPALIRKIPPVRAAAGPREGSAAAGPATVATLATLAIAALIGWGTLSPPGDGGFPLPLTDKQIHAAAFAALVLPLGWTGPARLAWLAPLALAYGGAIELIQPLVGRSGDWADLAADAVGIAGAALLCRLRVRRGGT